ncbi:50S ribosomal protein L15 [Candidatus Omnitrophota bacterium]
MQLHDIKPKVKNKKAKRFGRGSGSGHGKTSGRGHKGAGQRSGRMHYIGHEGDNVPFFRKFPKRGFNHRKRFDFQLVNVQSLEAAFKTDDTVSPGTLFTSRLVRKKDGLIKILGKGVINKALSVSAHKFSERAKEKIEKAGGKVEFLPMTRLTNKEKDA